MLRIIVLSLLLLSSTASAGEPLFCWGKSIRRVTNELKADQDVVGTSPLKSLRTSCGGGYDEYGNLTEKWDCFVQIWRARVNDRMVFLWTAYGRVNSDWTLSSVKVCDHIDASTCSDFPGTIRRCEDIRTRNSSLSF